MNNSVQTIQAVLTESNFAPQAIIRRSGRYLVFNASVIVFSYAERRHIRQECNFRIIAAEYIALAKMAENEALIANVSWASIKKGKGEGFEFTLNSKNDVVDTMCYQGVDNMMKQKARPEFARPVFA